MLANLGGLLLSNHFQFDRMQIRAPSGDRVEHDKCYGSLQVTDAFGGKREATTRPVLVRRTDELDGGTKLRPALILENMDRHPMDAGKVHGRRQTGPRRRPHSGRYPAQR